MKKILTILPILFISFISYSQSNILITYDFKFKENIYSEKYTTTTVRLYYNESKSTFLDQTVIQEFIDKKNGTPPYPGSRAPVRYIVYKDFQKNETLISQTIKPKFIGYSTPVYTLKQWNITKEKAKIKNYSTFKATTNYGGREWVAWFTNDFPINDGPYIFSGLPGLIVSLSSTDGDFKFEINDIFSLKKGDLLPEKPKCEIVTKEKFHYYLKNQSSILYEFLSTKIKDLTMTVNGRAMTADENKKSIEKSDKDRIHIEYK